MHCNVIVWQLGWEIGFKRDEFKNNVISEQPLAIMVLNRPNMHCIVIVSQLKKSVLNQTN